jgi:hypothetical protein
MHLPPGPSRVRVHEQKYGWLRIRKDGRYIRLCPIQIKKLAKYLEIRTPKP